MKKHQSNTIIFDAKESKESKDDAAFVAFDQHRWSGFTC